MTRDSIRRRAGVVVAVVAVGLLTLGALQIASAQRSDAQERRALAGAATVTAELAQGQPQPPPGRPPMPGGVGGAPPFPGPPPGFGGAFGETWPSGAYGLGGLRGGSYSQQFMTTGIPTDEEIEEIVYDAIDDDPFIAWDAPIVVEARNGVVTLSGTVPNPRMRHAAEDDAWWVPGVKDVHNEIRVEGTHRHPRRVQHREQP